jgi:hypothetical protein
LEIGGTESGVLATIDPDWIPHIKAWPIGGRPDVRRVLVTREPAIFIRPRICFVSSERKTGDKALLRLTAILRFNPKSAVRTGGMTLIPTSFALAPKLDSYRSQE